MQILTRRSNWILLLIITIGSYNLSAQLSVKTNQASAPDSSGAKNQVVPEIKSDVPPEFIDSLNAFFDTIIRFPVFGPNALDSFIGKNGKEDLLKKIDAAIFKTKSALESNNIEKLSLHTSMELRLINKQFKLGMDSTLPIYPDSKGYFLKLYDLYEAIPKEAWAMIDTIRMSKMDMYEPFSQSLGNRDTRMGFSIFGNLLTISDRLLDTIYGYTVNNLQGNDRIEMYWGITEYCRSLPVKNETAEKYKSLLFDDLYADYNFQRLFAKLYDKKNESAINTKFQPAFKMLAYGLYGNNITLKDHGKDILYLVFTMRDIGGWQKRFSSSAVTDLNMSVYGLWALLEARKQLKSYNPEPKK